MADSALVQDFHNGDMSNMDQHQDDGAFVNRSRSRSPVRKASRSRSRSPRRDRQSDSKRRDVPVLNSKRVYVSNIPYDTRWMTLKDVFKNEVGEVAYVELHEDPSGKPLGSGIVEFRDKETAQKAVEAMHRYDLKGRKLVVREERESDRRRIQRVREEAMGRGGGGGNSDVMNRGNNDMARGIMDDMQGGMMPAGGMMQTNNNSLVTNAPSIPGVSPQLLQSLGIEGPVTQQVFVANLDYKVTDKKVKDIFKMAGKVEVVELKCDKDGKSRGMATVRFETPLEAIQSISMFHGQVLYDRAMSVRMDKMAEPSGSAPVPNKLPSGLKSIGMGLGANGMPIATSPLGNLAPMASNIGVMSNMGQQGIIGGMQSDLNLGQMAGMLPGQLAGMSGQLGIQSQMAQMNQLQLQNQLNMAQNNMATMANMNQGNPMMMQQNQLSDQLQLGGNRGDGLLGQAGSSMNSLMNNNMMNQAAAVQQRQRSISQTRTPAQGGGGSGDENSSVFVENLPFNYTWQNLKERFRHIGEVRYAAIKTENGKSKGCGVVRFATMEAARAAIREMSGARIESRPIRVSLLNRDRV